MFGRVRLYRARDLADIGSNAKARGMDMLNPIVAVPIARPPLSIVYLVTNPAMPGLVKIGRTSQEDAQARLDQLYTTGVPVPFELVFACRVANSEEVERALHIAFAPQRVNPKREFFRIESDQALAILRLLHVEDATQTVIDQPSTISVQEQNATEELRKRRPKLDFDVMGIPVSAELQSTRNDDVATVISGRRVSFRGEETSLSAATQLMLQVDYPIAPGNFWSYQGRTIKDWYEDVHGD